jgi:hypothetical protein
MSAFNADANELKLDPCNSDHRVCEKLGGRNLRENFDEAGTGTQDGGVPAGATAEVELPL